MEKISVTTSTEEHHTRQIGDDMGIVYNKQTKKYRQTYDKKNNAIDRVQFLDEDTGLWSEWKSPIIGYSGNFVYDKTIDSLNMTVLFRQKDEPNVGMMNWVRFLHTTRDIDGKYETNLTYTDLGLPDNHEEYVITAIEKFQDKQKRFWTVKFQLDEPIKVASGWITQTRSFTNQTSKTVLNTDGSTTTYTKEPYTCLTALERVLKVHPTNQDDFDAEDIREIGKSLWSRITILDTDREWLETLPFNDETFTSSDMFRILFKFDDIVDKTPVMYFDKFTPASETYNGKPRKTYKLHFERKDGYDKPIIQYEDLTQSAFDIKISQTLDTYAKGIVSEVDNMTTGIPIIFPAENLWAVPEQDTNNRSTTSGDTRNWYIAMPFKIKRVTKIERLYIYGRDGGPLFYVPGTLTRENGERNALENQEYLASELWSSGRIGEIAHFTEGDTKLYLNDYQRNTNGSTYVYRITFEALIDSSIYYGNDSEYVLSINQTDSQVENWKYSSYLDNYRETFDRADITFTKKFYSWNEWKDLVGSLVVKDNEYYVISQVGYQNANCVNMVAFQLNKDNIRRNINARASEQIRANKVIDYANITDTRMRLKMPTLKLSLNNKNVNNNNTNLYADWILTTILNNVEEVDISLNPQVAILTVDSKNIRDFKKEFLIQFTKQINYNQIQFTFQFNKNAEISRKKVPDFKREADGSIIYDYHFMDIKEQIPLLFTDPFGELDKISLSLTRIIDNDMYDYDYTRVAGNTSENNILDYEYNRTKRMFLSISNLPEIPSEYRDELVNGIIENINNINYSKDMLEKFQMSISFDIEPDNFKIGKYLLENSRLITTENKKANSIYALNRIVYDEDVITNDNIIGGSSIYNTETYDNHIRFRVLLPIADIEDAKSIVITSGNEKEKLLIFNNPYDIIEQWKTGYIDLYYWLEE